MSTSLGYFSAHAESIEMIIPIALWTAFFVINFNIAMMIPLLPFIERDVGLSSVCGGSHACRVSDCCPHQQPDAWSADRPVRPEALYRFRSSGLHAYAAIDRGGA
jgi:hypothetical protein